MKKLTASILLLNFVLIASGCAKRADAISPTAIPSNAYSSLDCKQLLEVLYAEHSKMSGLEMQQNAAANGDAFGVFLLGIPTASVLGGNKEGELSVAKGRVLAVHNTMLAKSCEDIPNIKI